MLLGLDIGGTSVKAAALSGGRVLATSRSDPYSRPDREALVASLRCAVERLAPAASGEAVERVGLCAPGLLDESVMTIRAAVNVPGIVGVPLRELVGKVLGREVPLVCATDAHAAAVDILETSSPRLRGRLMAISIGTGVGASVLDDGVPLLVSGRSPGHFGQIDVSIEESRPEPVGPDGGRGGLEAYIALASLRERFGGEERVIEGLSRDDVPLRALARAIRVAHAIYRPMHVRLLGGVGVRLGPYLSNLQSMVREGLTSLARDGWTLECGSDFFHAALGVARIADAIAPQERG